MSAAASLDSILKTEGPGLELFSHLPFASCASFALVNTICAKIFSDYKLKERFTKLVSFHQTKFFSLLKNFRVHLPDERVYERLQKQLKLLHGTWKGRHLFLTYFPLLEPTHAKHQMVFSFFSHFSNFIQCRLEMKEVLESGELVIPSSLSSEEKENMMVSFLRRKGWKQTPHPYLEEALDTLLNLFCINKENITAIATEFNRFSLGKCEKKELSQIEAIFKEFLPYAMPYLETVRAAIDEIVAEKEKERDEKIDQIPSDILVSVRNVLQQMNLPPQMIRKVLAEQILPQIPPHLQRMPHPARDIDDTKFAQVYAVLAACFMVWFILAIFIS